MASFLRTSILAISALMTAPALLAQVTPSSLAVHVQSVDIMSDIHGADLSAYIRGLTHIVGEGTTPVDRSSSAVIRITIQPDGRISALHLDTSSHDIAFDKAAWGAFVKQARLPMPPAGPLELRFHLD